MPPRARRGALLLAPAVLSASLLAGCASDPPTVSPSGVDGLEVPTPSPDPADFAGRIDNPWLPLLPGARWRYESDDGSSTTVTVTERTREVAGVTATVVRDVVTDEDGLVVVETEDWFAQDRDGNVWYLGTDTPARSGAGGDRRGDADASWEAGVDGAEAGLAMAARPRRGDGYQQEQASGVAEDRVEVLSVGEEAVTVGDRTYDDLLVTEGTTPLEPDLVERRHYARGTGLVLEETLSGGSGEARLVGFTPGAGAR